MRSARSARRPAVAPANAACPVRPVCLDWTVVTASTATLETSDRPETRCLCPTCTCQNFPSSARARRRPDRMETRAAPAILDSPATTASQATPVRPATKANAARRDDQAKTADLVSAAPLDLPEASCQVSSPVTKVNPAALARRVRLASQVLPESPAEMVTTVVPASLETAASPASQATQANRAALAPLAIQARRDRATSAHRRVSLPDIRRHEGVLEEQTSQQMQQLVVIFVMATTSLLGAVRG